MQQGFRGNDEAMNQRLRPCIRENKNAKMAKICNQQSLTPQTLKRIRYCITLIKMLFQYASSQYHLCVPLHVQAHSLLSFFH